MSTDQRPHSRACGWAHHDHGPQCSQDCPTCSSIGGALISDGLRQHLAWVASAAIERWKFDPSPDTLSAMRTAVSGLSPWLAEDGTP